MNEYNFSVEELAALNSIGYQAGSLRENEEIEDFMDKLSYGALEFALDIRKLFENSRGILHLIDLEINKRGINGEAREVLFNVWSSLLRENHAKKVYREQLSKNDILRAFDKYIEAKSL